MANEFDLILVTHLWAHSNEPKTKLNHEKNLIHVGRCGDGDIVCLVQRR
jgi:hypothetical protein